MASTGSTPDRSPPPTLVKAIVKLTTLDAETRAKLLEFAVEITGESRLDRSWYVRCTHATLDKIELCEWVKSVERDVRLRLFH